MSIYDSPEKINPVKDREGSQRPSVFNGVKSFLESEKGKDIMVVIIVILVGLGAFELGRLSKENGSSGVKIEYPNQTTNTISAISDVQRPTTATAKTFFASSKGSKYYTISCSAGKTIKQENRIYFASGEEAEKAGYVLSSACN